MKYLIDHKNGLVHLKLVLTISTRYLEFSYIASICDTCLLCKFQLEICLLQIGKCLPALNHFQEHGLGKGETSLCGKMSESWGFLTTHPNTNLVGTTYLSILKLICHFKVAGTVRPRKKTGLHIQVDTRLNHLSWNRSYHCLPSRWTPRVWIKKKQFGARDRSSWTLLSLTLTRVIRSASALAHGSPMINHKTSGLSQPTSPSLLLPNVSSCSLRWPRSRRTDATLSW